MTMRIPTTNWHRKVSSKLIKRRFESGFKLSLGLSPFDRLSLLCILIQLKLKFYILAQLT